MNDTSPEMQKIYRDKLMTLPPEKRMIMCAQMFESARTMVLASLPEGLSQNEIRKHLLLRFYADDLKLSKSFLEGFL